MVSSLTPTASPFPKMESQLHPTNDVTFRQISLALGAKHNVCTIRSGRIQISQVQKLQKYIGM